MPGVTKISYTKGSRGHLETSGILRCAGNRKGAIKPAGGASRPEIMGFRGFTRWFPTMLYICGIMGLSISMAEVFVWLTGETLFHPTKKEASFHPIFNNHHRGPPSKMSHSSRHGFPEKKTPFILEVPIYLDPAGSYHLWRRVTEKSDFFLGTNLQPCKLEESRLIFVGWNASHVKNDKMNKMNAKP